MILSLIILFFSLILAHLPGLALSAAYESILHCVIYDENPTLEVICLKCQKNYVLNQFSTFCEPQENFAHSLNCIQISSFGECMRCDCGYAIQQSLGSCVLTTNLLIGCEIFTEKENNLCTRPKRDYLLFKGSQGEITVQFARGSHCQIFDSLSKIYRFHMNIHINCSVFCQTLGNLCIQCHAGYLLSQDYHCIRYPHRIFNEYFSFFSSDGELESRSLLFIAQSDGVYPKINNCLVYKKKLNEFSLECELCGSGKVLNSNKTECLRQIVDFCKIIEETRESSGQKVCSKCLDNDHFYLNGSDPKQQLCLPRQQNLDPTIRCLVQFDNLQGCQTCAVGLFPTSTGCSLENPRLLSSEESSHQPQENQLFYESCEYWIDENTCGSCKKRMIPNDKGACMFIIDKNCLLARENGSCAQCISLMYYSLKHRKCVLIEKYLDCRRSLGRSNSCEICINNFYLNANGICMPTQITNCSMSLGKQRKCETCNNLHFLTEDFFCNSITSYRNCLLSDGIANFCFKCYRGYISDEIGICISNIAVEDNACASPLFYLEEQETPVKEGTISNTRCVEYHFENNNKCERFHKTKNECLECASGYYLMSGICLLIYHCISSDGINNHCYQYSFEAQYLDKHGKSKIITKTCDMKKFDTMCASCFLDDKTEGILIEYEHIPASPSQQPSQSVNVCTHFEEVSSLDVFPNCLHLAVSDNSYKCILCINLYYLTEKGECKAFPKDSNCEVSDGKSLKCIRCRKNYNANLENDDSCEIYSAEKLNAIPFCEIQQGIECKKCKSLYYVSNKGLCYPIFDPECESSNGVSSVCEQCRNGQIFKQLFYIGIICNSNLCFQVDPATGECQMCLNGYMFTEVTEKEQEENHKSQAFKCVEKVHSCLESDNQQFVHCFNCEEGQYLNQLRFRKAMCLTIPIENCIIFDQTNHACQKCKEGYDILQSGLCFKLSRCFEYNDGCLKCSKEFFLKDGVCIQIRNCIDQLFHQCLLCAPGYWVRNDSRNIQRMIGYQNIYQDICQKIPNCVGSNGITESCIMCESGFDIQNELCIRNNSLKLPNCLIFDESNGQCLECENLFFITNGNCFEIRESTNCQRSNGIKNICQLCSLNGFKHEDTICFKIENCFVSNGIDLCVICEENYIVNIIDGGCDKINVQIANCQIVSYNRLFVRSDNCEEVDEQSLELRNIQYQSTIDIPTNNHICNKYKPTSNQEDILIQLCSQCDNFYYLQDNQQECLRMSAEFINTCSVSDGQSQYCSVCQQGYFLMAKSYHQPICSSQNKKLNKRSNQGCQLFDHIEMIECVKCEVGFFMKTKFTPCMHRNEQDTKCLRFSPRKDECEICRSGYKKKEVIRKGITMSFCMRLEAKEQVRNCQEYQPGTDKCIKCQKNITSFDVVEFFLDEEKNICEDVLHLMCKTIDIAGKQCIEFFIPNCERAAGSKCDICKNGFYLTDSQKLQESSLRYSCMKHKVIRNCLVYSQQYQDSCEKCEDYYELANESKGKVCSQIKQRNCKQTNGSTCVECSGDRFAIDVTSGTCLVSQISKCLELEIEQKLPQNGQVCLKCSHNYILSENKSKCIWRLPDLNCLKSDQSRNCLECQEGYLLTQKGDCMRLNSPCSLLNCLKYKEISESQQMICEQCSSNYVLDKNQRCQLLDPYSSKSENITDSMKSYNDSKIKREQFWYLWIAILLSVAGAIVLCMLICCVIKVLKIKRENNDQKDKQSKFRLSVDIEIPMDQSMGMNLKSEIGNRDKGIVVAVADDISYMQFNSINE